MAAGPQRMAFDDLTMHEDQTKRAAAVTVHLRSADFSQRDQTGGRARIELGVVYDRGGPAFESYRTWMYHNPAWLEDKNGRVITPEAPLSTQQQGDGSVAIEYNFAQVSGQPGNYRFIYIVPSLICELPVEFRFPRITLQPAASKGATP